MNADPVQPLLVMLISSPLLLLAIWGGVTTWRLEQRLSHVLDATLDALDALGLKQVTSGTENARVRAASAEALGPAPALAGAWQRWHDTIVDVAGRPRSTRPTAHYLDEDAILADHAQSVRGVLSAGFMETLPVNW